MIVGMKEGTSLSCSIAVSGPVSLRSLRANGGGRGHSQRGCGPAARPTDCGMSYQGCPSAFISELWDQVRPVMKGRQRCKETKDHVEKLNIHYNKPDRVKDFSAVYLNIEFKQD